MQSNAKIPISTTNSGRTCDELENINDHSYHNKQSYA